MRTTRCQTRKRAQVKTLTARYESEVKAEKPGKGKLTVEEKMEVMKRAEEEAEAIVRQSIQISGWQGKCCLCGWH